ncbi:MAG: TolC family protein [bacterium]|nr:TolC family protein [bacterium]
MKRHVLFVILMIFSAGFYSSGEGTKLSLSDCLEIAQKKHPSLISAKEAITIATAQQKQTISAYYPQVNVTAQYNRKEVAETSSDDAYAGSASVAQLIYDFGVTPALIRQANENINLKLINYLDTELSIFLNVKTAYYSVLETQELVAIAKESLDNAKLHLKLAEKSYTVGKGTKLDVMKAEVAVANAELTLVTALNNQKIAISTLFNAMGVEPNTDEPIELIETLFSPITTALSTFITQALQNRPDVQSLIHQRKQLQASLLIAERGHLPTISASGSYNLSGNEFPLTESWTATLGLNFSLYDGSKKEGKIAEAKSALRQLTAQEQKMIQDIQLEVTTNYLNTKSEQEKINAAQKLVDQAKESLRLATSRYENGLGSILDLTDAQVAYRDARVSLAQAIYAAQRSYAQLQKSIGQK